MATTPGTQTSNGNTGTDDSGIGLGAGTGTGETYGGGDIGLQADVATTPLDTAGPASSGGGSGGEAASNRRAEARSRFTAALEEARAGLEALRADAAERGASYRAKATGSTGDWVQELKSMSGEARKRAEDVASQGKTRASDSLSSFGKALSDTASVIDERLGPKYGDYARSAARAIQENAARLESKEMNEISDDVRGFVRKSPGAAVGIAAVAGFFIARLLGVGGDKD